MSAVIQLHALLVAAVTFVAAALPTSSPMPVRTVTLTPVEFASSYSTECGGSASRGGSPAEPRAQPPYAHPPSTVFVGGVARNGVICSLYQGLARFDLDGLDAASIQSAHLFYEAKQDYTVDGSPNRNRATCIGSIGTVSQAWSAEDKAITPVLAQRDSMRAPRVNFKTPPIDVTAFLRAHLDDVKSNGLAFDGMVENTPPRYCLSAVGNIELRLAISGAL